MQKRTLNGAAVKAIREALGLAGGTFAIQCGMSHSQLSNIEAGRKTATEAAARRISERLAAAFPVPAHPRVRIDVWQAITYPVEEAA